MTPARNLRAFLAATLLGMLAGCGQKGPLTLPEQAEPSAVAVGGDAGDAGETDETDERRDETEENDR